MQVSTDTLMAFTIGMIQDVHNIVYDEMQTYY